MSEIAFREIGKTYGNGVVAVEHFTLEIAEDEFVVLVGPSGCGKSTVLRMIAGLEEITAGELLIDGRRMNDVAPKNRDIAMVFQNYALYPHMNVYQNMAFGLKMRKKGKKEIERRIRETADLLQISELLQRKPAELSGGQRQRVALGRAMVREPKVFLLDEPLSNLDAKLRTEMRLKIGKLHQQLKTTFVYVTHDQTEAMTMANRIVVMKDGHIQQIGSPTEIYQRPGNLFVAEFIGSPKINVLPAKLFEQADHDDILVGIRPESVLLDPIGAGVRGKAVVEMKEEMGSETYYYLNFNNYRLTARVSGTGLLKTGEWTNIGFQQDQIHFFDKNTGNRLESDQL